MAYLVLEVLYMFPKSNMLWLLLLLLLHFGQQRFLKFHPWSQVVQQVVRRSLPIEIKN